MLGKGRAAAITDLDIYRLALRLDVPPENLEALSEVESNGFGWFDDGRMKILFEKHWFYKLLPLVPASARDNAAKSGLARKTWISPAKGGYKDQNTAAQRYDLLTRAMKINESAALQSISMGRFQIMGFNYEVCGFKSVQEMWEKFLDDEENQLEALANFLRKKNLLDALRTGNFQKIETVYNGGGLNGVYAKKMEATARKLSGKWQAFKPDPAQATIPKPLPIDLPDDHDAPPKPQLPPDAPIHVEPLPQSKKGNPMPLIIVGAVILAVLALVILGAR